MVTTLTKATRKYLAEIGSEGGKKGGKARTAKKSEAARKNGTLGGRPKQVKPNGKKKGK